MQANTIFPRNAARPDKTVPAKSATRAGASPSAARMVESARVTGTAAGATASSTPRVVPLRRQPFAQNLSALFEPVLEGTQRPAELAGGLLAHLAVKIATKDRLPARTGQSAHFLVEDFAEIGIPRRLVAAHFASLAFMSQPAGDAGAELDRRSPGDLVQPPGHRAPPSGTAGLPCESEKGDLKGVVSIGRVAQHAATDAEHHRPVPANQRGESVLVAGGKACQEFVIGRLIDRSAQRPA